MLIVDISGIVVARDPEAVIVTYSLGSCVGLTLYDATAGIAGMAHMMLPLSKTSPAKAEAKPGMFVDTGVATLLRTMLSQGARKQNLVAKVAGAGSPLGNEKVFKIGQRNYTILRKLLWKNDILIESEQVGGQAPRSLFIEVATGRTHIKSRGEESEL
ncbi:MAG: chemotaxis protein CheD [bacterium]|nr:chemotaxis protein CheD [bacterium]